MTAQPTCSCCGKSFERLFNGLCPVCQSTNEKTLAPTSTNEAHTVHPSEIRNSSSLNDSTASTTFGDYELLEEIARGGMGIVYRARHRTLNRITALKMVLGGKFSSDEELQRFHIEAEAAAKLDHPGIVPIYEIGNSEGQAFFAMKYIAGGSLSNHMQRVRQSTRKSVELLVNVANAVNHAHQRGILHRDLKPANILLDDNDRPLLTDLGLAKNITHGSDLTHSGAVLGTPGYMPPEQASGEAVTTAADTYSLGAILYELLTGQPPYSGTSAVDTLMKVLAAPPLPPSKVSQAVDRDLELICLKSMSRNPNERYDSPLAMANDLNAWLAGESISIKAPSFAALAGRWFRRNQRLAYIAFALFLGCIFSLPFLLLFLSGNAVDVYSHFPEDAKPWIYNVVHLPNWLGFVALFSLVFVVWPSIGLLNAAIAKPDSWLGALWSGFLTSMMFSAVFVLLLGTFVAAQGAVNQSNEYVAKMARAIWPPEGTSPANEIEIANKMFSGLENIPVGKRARIVADRIFLDQLASVSGSLGVIATVLTLFSFPIIYGTMIGSILLRRSTHVAVTVFRYAVVWFALMALPIFVFLFLVPSVLERHPLSRVPYAVPSILLILIAIIFLTMRRWRRGEFLTTSSTTNPTSSQPISQPAP